MTELLGIAIISFSILGLVYSIGNIILTITKPSTQLNSLSNINAFQRGFYDGKQKVGNV